MRKGMRGLTNEQKMSAGFWEMGRGWDTVNGIQWGGRGSVVMYNKCFGEVLGS